MSSDSTSGSALSAGRDRIPLLVTALSLVTTVLLFGRGNYILGSALSLLRLPLLVSLGVGAWRSRWNRRGILLAATCAVTLGGEWGFTRLGRAATWSSKGERGRTLTVVSHNLLYEGGHPEKTMALLRAQDADLLSLQEVTPAWAARLEALSSRYPHRLLAPRVGAHGYAILSKHPLRNEVLLTEGAPPAFAQCADVVLPSVSSEKSGRPRSGKSGRS
jgi:endonuclease/exonuclease/phosphatase (EEP) superfamily protein YafD